MERVMVKKRLKSAVKIRKGRGYSLAELREVDHDGFKAMEKGTAVVKYRRTKHEENIRSFSSTFKEKLAPPLKKSKFSA
jgi:ribosomal protein L13E